MTVPENVGNPAELTVRALAERVLDLTESGAGLAYEPLPVDDPKVRQPDITLARTRLGWEPRVALDDGLAETIAYFRELGARGDAGGLAAGARAAAPARR